jgi:hypothetical protein
MTKYFVIEEHSIILSKQSGFNSNRIMVARLIQPTFFKVSNLPEQHIFIFSYSPLPLLTLPCENDYLNFEI